MSNNIICSR